MPNLLPHLSQLGTLSVLLVVLVLCAMEATLLLGSLVLGEPVIVAAAALLGLDHVLAVTLAAALGSMTGQGLGYLLGRGAGGRIRSSWLGRRLGDRAWARSEALVRQATIPTMVAVRFVAIGHTLAPVLAGTMGMRHCRFLQLSAVSSLAWAAVWAGLGVATAGLGSVVDSDLLALVLGLVGMVVAGITLGRAAARMLPAGSP